MTCGPWSVKRTSGGPQLTTETSTKAEATATVVTLLMATQRTTFEKRSVKTKTNRFRALFSAADGGCQG